MLEIPGNYPHHEYLNQSAVDLLRVTRDVRSDTLHDCARSQAGVDLYTHAVALHTAAQDFALRLAAFDAAVQRTVKARRSL